MLLSLNAICVTNDPIFSPKIGSELIFPSKSEDVSSDLKESTDSVEITIAVSESD